MLALAVLAGGGLGALARVALASALATTPGGWPWATLTANLAGSALLGWLLTRFDPPRHALVRALLGPGLCGALTTFSTLQLETILIARAGRPGTAAAYAAASAGLGLACAVAGAAVGGRRA